MQEKDFKTIEKLKHLISQKIKVHEVRVFGSRARGDATQESDLDVLIVVDSLDHAIEKYISDCAWEVGFPEDIIKGKGVSALYNQSSWSLNFF
jgi:uncharacterized protein